MNRVRIMGFVGVLGFVRVLSADPIVGFSDCFFGFLSSLDDSSGCSGNTSLTKCERFISHRCPYKRASTPTESEVVCSMIH